MASSVMCLRPVISDLGWFSPETASARLAMFLARSPMRSRSPAIFNTVMMWRRSLAMGWRRAIIRMVCSCRSRSSRSMLRSLATAASASLGSRRSSASKPCASSRSANPPICAIFLSSCCSSWSNDLTVCSSIWAPLACGLRHLRSAGNAGLSARSRRRAPTRQRNRRHLLVNRTRLGLLASTHNPNMTYNHMILLVLCETNPAPAG